MKIYVFKNPKTKKYRKTIYFDELTYTSTYDEVEDLIEADVTTLPINASNTFYEIIPYKKELRKNKLKYLSECL